MTAPSRPASPLRCYTLPRRFGAGRHPSTVETLQLDRWNGVMRRSLLPSSLVHLVLDNFVNELVPGALGTGCP
jgi:hypothetical protein